MTDDKMETFNCCGGDSDESVGECEICDVPVETRITPGGTHKYPGQERVYISGDCKEKLTRDKYNEWAKGLGAGEDFDVAKAWFVEMGHGPIPDDVKL